MSEDREDAESIGQDWSNAVDAGLVRGLVPKFDRPGLRDEPGG
jgi:hypothetical protein